MKRALFFRALLPVACFLGGCSATVVTRDISCQAPDSEIRGVPFRLAARQRIVVFALQADGTYARVHEAITDLPDQARMFAVDLDADWLSDHRLALELGAAGTLMKAEITATSKGEAALAQAGASMSGIATAVATLEQKRSELEVADTAKREAQAAREKAAAGEREQLLLDFRVALEAVLKAEAELRLATDLTPLDREQREADLRVLRLKANQAARRLGQVAPYPGADALP